MALALNPVLLVHAGVVWKDVLLAHAVVLAWLWIDCTPAQTRRKQMASVLGIALLLSLVAAVRQQRWFLDLPLMKCGIACNDRCATLVGLFSMDMARTNQRPLQRLGRSMLVPGRNGSHD